MQELLKCLAHADLQPDHNSGDAGDVVDVGGLGDDKNGDSDEEEADDNVEKGGDLHCPSCEQEHESLRKLKRHFAIRILPATH